MTANYSVADAALIDLSKDFSANSWWGSASVEFDRNLGQYFIQVWIVPDAKHTLPSVKDSIKVNVVNKAMPVIRY